jgi:Tfp pilus assembly protein PilV
MKLKSTVLSKLQSSAGEALAEVLVAILIAALALTMLASAITSTTKMVNQSKVKMEAYYAENDSMAIQDQEEAAGQLTVTLTEGETPRTLNGEAIKANYCMNTMVGRTKVISYWLFTEEEGE